MCLSEKPANYVFKKVEEGEIINVNTLKQELEQVLDREDDNPYKMVVLNKVYRNEDKTLQVENWSIFTDKSNMCIMMKGPHTDLTCTP